VAWLYSKHFGDKVFLSDLNGVIVDKMLISQTNINKMPNFGILGRFDDGTVGLSVWYVGKYGNIILLKEPTTHKTICSWANFHTNGKLPCVRS